MHVHSRKKNFKININNKKNNLLVWDSLVVSNFIHFKNATLNISVHIALHFPPVLSFPQDKTSEVKLAGQMLAFQSPLI